MSPEPGILGRLSVGSSGGSRKPAHEQSNSDETTRKIAAENAVASLMRTIRYGSWNAVKSWIETPMAISAGTGQSAAERWTDLNRLKEIVIDPFHCVGRVRGHRHPKFDHEFSQAWSVYQNDLVFDLWDVIVRILRKIWCCNENSFARVLAMQRASELLNLRTAHRRRPSLCLNVDNIKAHAILFYDSVQTFVTGFTYGLRGIGGAWKVRIATFNMVPPAETK
jgi:hypothetical protein